MRREQSAPPPHCAYCGRALAADRPAIERFGEPFCSERHAEEFAAGVRAARVDAAARRGGDDQGLARPRRRSGVWTVGALMLGVLLVALIWGGGTSSGVIPGAGALLTLLLLLACPLAMYFMMRGMGGMGHGGKAQDGSGDHSATDKRARPGQPESH